MTLLVSKAGYEADHERWRAGSLLSVGNATCSMSAATSISLVRNRTPVGQLLGEAR